MKFVIAVIQPHKLDAVRRHWSQVGVQGLTVSEVRGFGRQKGHSEIYRGAEYQIAYVPKIKIEIAVADSQAERVVKTITQTARTGTIGDGKIFILDLDFRGAGAYRRDRRGRTIVAVPAAQGARRAVQPRGASMTAVASPLRGVYPRTPLALARHAAPA